MKICFHPHPPHHSGLEKAVENDKSETQSLKCGNIVCFLPGTFPMRRKDAKSGMHGKYAYAIFFTQAVLIFGL